MTWAMRVFKIHHFSKQEFRNYANLKNAGTTYLDQNLLGLKESSINLSMKVFEEMLKHTFALS